MTIGSYASHNNIISPSVNRELRLGGEVGLHTTGDLVPIRAEKL